MPDPTQWIGTRITLACCCRCLGIEPPLRPRQKITWWARNDDTGIGINAEIRCFDPVREEEPYVLSIGVYETVRVIGLAGQDYGTDHTVIAAFDFALEAPEGEMLPSLNDLQNTRLKLVRAELGAGLGDDDDDPSLEAVLAELGRILESGPAERETLAPIEA
jgi:hypothetical protein